MSSDPVPVWIVERGGTAHRVTLVGSSAWSGRPRMVRIDASQVALRWQRRALDRFEADLEVGGAPAQLVMRPHRLSERLRRVRRQVPRAFLIDLVFTLLSGSTAVGAGAAAGSYTDSMMIIELVVDGDVVPPRDEGEPAR